MFVYVRYGLSKKGQRAAFLAGKCAMSIVSEVMSFDDASLLDYFSIESDGKAYYNVQNDHGEPAFSLDTPPSGLMELIEKGQEHRSMIQKLREDQEQKKIREDLERKRARLEASKRSGF